MTKEHETQQKLLAELRAKGTPEALEQVSTLQEMYHAQQMADLSTDVYQAGKGAGEAPEGWTRVSASPELLRQMMPGLELSDEQIRQYLQPDDSGFRAEIYMPDPAILGPGYKPTLVFKGSAGEVVENGELHSTAVEDFIGNNFPQAIGLQTDYYDRSMELATVLKSHGLDFDISGHSLGGGMASAASAVTGMRAVTFNAAGLHSATAERFLQAREHAGQQQYDTDRTVTAWQVEGDILSDGIQSELRSLSPEQRQRLVSILSNTVETLENSPSGRDYLDEKIFSQMHEASRETVREFLERLDDKDAADLISELPEAAGERKAALPAYARDGDNLVRRQDEASLGRIHRLAEPVLEIANVTAIGARAGSEAGVAVAETGAMVGETLDLAGDVGEAGLDLLGQGFRRAWSGLGVVLEEGGRQAGEFAAHVRMAGAYIEAGFDQVQGWAAYNVSKVRGGFLRGLGSLAGLISDEWQEKLEERAERIEAEGLASRERNREEAEEALARGREAAKEWRVTGEEAGQTLHRVAENIGNGIRDGLMYVGDRLDEGLDVIGDGVTVVTSHAPTVGAFIGGVGGAFTGVTAKLDPTSAEGFWNIATSIQLVHEAMPAFKEGTIRHSMEEGVMPSLDHRVALQEQAARAALAGERIDVAELEKASAPAKEGHGLKGAIDNLLWVSKEGEEAVAKATSLLTGDIAKEWLEQGKARLNEIKESVLVEGAEKFQQSVQAVQTQLQAVQEEIGQSR